MFLTMNVFFNSDVFPEIFKARVIDTFKQEWCNSLERSSVLSVYKHFKSCLAYEKYLDILPYSSRHYLSKLRLSVLPLRIQTSRHQVNYLDRVQRLCTCCDLSEIEDEYHFVCICPKFEELRKRYLKTYYYVRPSVFKYVQLVCCVNRSTLVKLCKYVKEAMLLRNNYTHYLCYSSLSNTFTIAVEKDLHVFVLT